MISIIVPVYNIEKHLPRCIESILSQTYEDFELILVNDGSSDQSGRLCEEYARRDKRIRVVHIEHGGQSAARNAGLDVAKGDYIGLVDGDDYIHKDMCRSLLDSLQKSNSDIAMCDVSVVDENGKVDNESNQRLLKNEVITSYDALKKINSVPNFEKIWNKLYKSRLFEGLRFVKGRIFEDNYFIHEIIYKCDKIVTVPHKYYFYVQTQGSTTRRPATIEHLAATDSLCQRATFYEEHHLTELIDETAAKALDCFLRFRNCYKPKNTAEKRQFRSIKRKLRKLCLKYRKNISLIDYLNFETPYFFQFIRSLKNHYCS